MTNVEIEPGPEEGHCGGVVGPLDSVVFEDEASVHQHAHCSCSRVIENMAGDSFWCSISSNTILII